jgi:hypothetical protein
MMRGHLRTHGMALMVLQSEGWLHAVMAESLRKVVD